jgi:hypothetical protein
MTESWMRIVKDKRFTTGATFPYILAALRDPIGSVTSADASKEQLRGLLRSMRDDVPPPECVVILWCSRIEAIVASARPAPPEGRRCIRSPHDTNRGLYYREIDGYEVTDIDSLIEALWDLHKQVILEGRFNRDNRLWLHVNEQERREIEATLSGGS